MPKRMLIDATHPEETRVVVINGTRLEEFDFESSTKRQVKGNIYLAKVTRVEPSLQAAFVDYGGNRHGFLAFSEVHPDYYRIPVGDRPHGTAEPSDGNGDRARDNDAGNGEDAGVPLASALPEPVRVPLTDGEDDPLGDESDGEPSEKPVLAGEAHSREDGLRGDAPTQMSQEDSGGEAQAADREPATTALRAAEESIVAAEIPESRGAGTAGESWEWYDHPSDGEPGEEFTADREPATIALRAAEESVIVAEIPEADGAEAEEGRQRDDEPSEGERSDRFAAEQDDGEPSEFDNGDGDSADGGAVPDSVETLGGDEVEEVEEADAAERRRRHPMRH
jgi:ribonuclease E